MENENKNNLEEEVNETTQSAENLAEEQAEPETSEAEERISVETESTADETDMPEIKLFDETAEPEAEELLPEEETVKEDFYAPMDGDGGMPDEMMFSDDGPTALYTEDGTAEVITPPKKSNMAVFAVLGVIIVALLIVIAVLLVGNKPGFLNANGFKEIIVGTVDGVKVPEGAMRVFLAQEENSLLIQSMKEQLGDDWQTSDQNTLMSMVNNFDWSKKNADGVSYSQAAKNAAFDQATMVYVKAAKAKEMGIGLTEEEEQQMRAGISQAKTQFESEEAFLKMLNENYFFKDEQAYADFYILYQNALKFDSEYQQDPSKFITDEAALAEYLNDDTASVKHILIKTVDDSNQPLPEEQVALARAKAEEALSRAKAGEDFDALIDEYNQDPGQMQNKNGYAFGKGEMLAEFETASFALGVNEISELVETDFGYHIIKRIVGLSELEQQMLKEAKVRKKQGALNKLKLFSEIQKEQEAAAATASASPSPAA